MGALARAAGLALALHCAAEAYSPSAKYSHTSRGLLASTQQYIKQTLYNSTGCHDEPYQINTFDCPINDAVMIELRTDVAPYKNVRTGEPTRLGNCANFCSSRKQYDGTCLTRKHVRQQALRCVDTKNWLDSRLKTCADYDCGDGFKKSDGQDFYQFAVRGISALEACCKCGKELHDDLTAVSSVQYTCHGWSHAGDTRPNIHIVARDDRFSSEIGRYLMRGVPVDERSRNGWSALHDCADFGQLKACTVLVDRHANLDVVDDYGGTPVQHSAEKGHVEVTALLAASGANLEIQDHHGWTPLHHAALRGRAGTVRVLIHYGANVSIGAASPHPCPDNILRTCMEDITVWGHDGTALHAAAKGNRPAVAQMLLNAGAWVDQRDRYGWTALLRAAERGNYAVAAVLLAGGANPNAQGVSGGSPLDEALQFLHAPKSKSQIELNTTQAAQKLVELINTKGGGLRGQTPPQDFWAQRDKRPEEPTFQPRRESNSPYYKYKDAGFAARAKVGAPLVGSDGTVSEEAAKKGEAATEHSGWQGRRRMMSKLPKPKH